MQMLKEEDILEILRRIHKSVKEIYYSKKEKMAIIVVNKKNKIENHFYTL